jgi:hypothetical protein
MPLIVGVELSVEPPSGDIDASVSSSAYTFVLLRHVHDRDGMRFEDLFEFFAVSRAVVYDYDFVVSKRLGEDRIQSLSQVPRGVVDWNHHAYEWCFLL